MRNLVMRLALAELAVALCATAQSRVTQPEMSGHKHMPANVIDGAVSPDKIPDLPAYRLYLLAISKAPGASASKNNLSHSHQRNVGLSEVDRQVLERIADEFRYEYHNLIDAYNQAATESWSKEERTDIHIFTLQRDALVRSAIANLSSSLSESGWSLLRAHVQNEKKRMKISTLEAEQ